MGKNCVICGKPSGIYPLCFKHLQMKKNGEVVKCEKCGEWHLTSETCQCQQITYNELPVNGFDNCILCNAETNGYAFCYKCYKKHTEEELLDILNNSKLIQKELKNNIPETMKEEQQPNQNEIDEMPNQDEKENKVIVIDDENKSKCITCGKPTDGLLFCSNCYYKYKNKELLFKITNCTSIELIDEEYEGRYICKDGHIVKSKSERDIDNYLFENGITHAYEKELPYGPNRTEVLHPDFYLPNYLGKNNHVYIEHWGYNENNIAYTKTKKFKLPIYEKLGITLICTNEKTDVKDIEATLNRKLNKEFITPNKINE
ncbi:MAG: hypothetical protein NC087_01630 [Anaeroplasma bactoclasticum]|nr:hypothetical protein [Anaeroplasma bactoclasticum]